MTESNFLFNSGSDNLRVTSGDVIATQDLKFA